MSSINAPTRSRFGTVNCNMSGTESQNNILDAVQSVIVRDGVQGTSLRQVALEADVSLGLISYHFDDKDRLIFAVFERASDELREASNEAAALVEDPDEKVRAFIRGSFSEEFLNGDYLRLRVSLWAVSLTEPELAKVDRDYHQRYEETLASYVTSARSGLGETEVLSRCKNVVALTSGLWLDWARYHDDDALEQGLVLAEEIALAS